MEQPEREARVCDECGSKYFATSSQMDRLCPECAHRLYGYPNSDHILESGRCTKCGWDGACSEFLARSVNCTQERD
ncbi:MAG: hypothetical protein CMJ58_15640 [Planctomycetaceae bacterium]|nr:hypothetical protein [Planctomycetaceae bacterium]